MCVSSRSRSRCQAQSIPIPNVSMRGASVLMNGAFRFVLLQVHCHGAHGHECCSRVAPSRSLSAECPVYCACGETSAHNILYVTSRLVSCSTRVWGRGRQRRGMADARRYKRDNSLQRFTRSLTPEEKLQYDAIDGPGSRNKNK